MKKNWQPVIGFEIHVELSTNSKMFCGCPADHFSKAPNTQVCPVCLGLPGALPVPNAVAIESCVKLGLALGCNINTSSKFDRKNYFYPDLSKGYQISQYDQPFCYKGKVSLPSGKIVRITRVHMEEDTAKLQHGELDGQKVSFIDFNRSGVPLVEIVTEPDFDNTKDAIDFLKEIQVIVRLLKISTADMEKGSMRLEANISMRQEGETALPGYKVEIKNVNSFRFINKAMEYEIQRQTKELESGKTPAQETRGFDENKGITFSQRLKELAHDYRYFPEPDIPPIELDTKLINDWKNKLPELPEALRNQLVSRGVSQIKALTISSDALRIEMYNKLIQNHYDVNKAADLIINCPSDLLNDLNKIIDWDKTRQSKQVDLKTIDELVNRALKENPKVVSDYKSGKTQAISSLIGSIRRQSGNIDAQVLKEVLEREIKNL